MNEVSFFISKEDLASGPGIRGQAWSLKSFCVAEFY